MLIIISKTSKIIGIMEDMGHPLARKAARRLQRVLEAGAHTHQDYIAPETYEKILDKEGDLRGKKIAELGCGIIRTGKHQDETSYEESLVGRGALLIPVDFSEIAVSTWNLAKNQDVLRIAPLNADVLKLPFPAESLDGCISANVINLFPTVENPDCHAFAYKLLREAHRVLKKDGFMILSSFGYTKRTHKDGAVTYNNNIPAFQLVTPSEIRHLAQQVGFTQVEDLPLDEIALANTRDVLNNEIPPKILKREIIHPCAFLLRK